MRITIFYPTLLLEFLHIEGVLGFLTHTLASLLVEALSSMSSHDPDGMGYPNTIRKDVVVKVHVKSISVNQLIKKFICWICENCWQGDGHIQKATNNVLA